jgi:LacI family transcriptional regulator
MRKANIDDVANLAGVSNKTVSRVVNNEPNVRETTRLKVEKAVRKLNYQPSPSARSLAGKRSHLIGLLYDDPGLYENPSSSYIVNIQQGALRVCKSRNYDLVVHPCDYQGKNLNAEIKSLISISRVDGLILTPPLSDLSSLLTAIKKTDTPLVRISPGDAKDARFAVTTNDRQICASMTEYLAGLGHSRIAFVRGNRDHKALESRFLGYQDGLSIAGLPFRKGLVCEGDNSFGSGEECARNLLTGKKPPTAIFACNDDMATGVLRTAHKLGVNVPGDLSVAGFDDIPLAQQIFPSLTTIRQPVRSMAELAAEILMDRILSRQPTDVRSVDAELRVRESTGPAPHAATQ